MTETYANPVSTDRFTFKNFTYTADISDLGPSFLFGNVYSEEQSSVPGRGLTLLSKATGGVANFVITNVLYDREGDLQIWYLSPTPETIYRMSNFAEYKMVIFND